MLSISEIRELLKTGKISHTELAAEFISAAERENPALNAYITLTGETALEAARAADAKLARGEELPPLAGIPFAMSDNISTAGLKTTCASKMLENYTPVFDASVWKMLKSRDAALIGKCNMDEFAMTGMQYTSVFGDVRNPRGREHNAGGGAAAAVAAGLAAYAIATDTGGGLRLPAARCGVYGLRPTYGAVSRYGLIAHASSMDQIGPVAANVRDLALVFDAISDRDPRDMTSRGADEPVSPKLTGDITGMKIGIAKNWFKSMLPGYVETALEVAVKALERRGAVVTDVEFPGLNQAYAAYYVLSCAETSSNFGRFDGLMFGYRAENTADLDDFIKKSRNEGFGAEVRRRILFGTYALSSGNYAEYFEKAQILRRAVSGQMTQLLSEYDCLLAPVTYGSAPEFYYDITQYETMRRDAYTVPASLAGLPAASVPCGADPRGLPIGLQVIGRKNGEADILNAALAFERATDGAYLIQAEGGVKL